ncbi:hypothetical protein BJX99DRAFT_227977 [Aspergillus californicus]
MSLRSLSLLATALLTLTPAVQARTDLAGCISSATTNQWHEASMIWYVPGTGEICDFPDCGGGRAPPKSDNPACPLYTGTASYEPSYLEGYGPGAAAAATTSTAEATSTSTTPAKATTSVDEEEEEEETASSVGSGSLTISARPTGGIVGVETPRVTPSASLVPSSSASAVSSSASGNGNAAVTGSGEYTGENGVGMLRVHAGVGAVGLLVALML